MKMNIFKKLNIKFKGGVTIALLGVFLITYTAVATVNYIGYKYVDRALKTGYVYIPTGSTLKDQSAILLENGFIKDSSDYQLFSKMMKITTPYPGKYKLQKDMSYKEIMEILNKGQQSPTKVTFIPTNRLGILASKIASQIEPDSSTIINAIKNHSIQKTYNLDSISIPTIFIPNTYEFYWNTTAEEFIARMHREYKKFWQTREHLLDSINMTKLQVMTLASIVYAETKYAPEMPTVAGVYINRIKRGMPLQADPTVVYANKDWSIKRVLKKHLEIKSPYNTYKYRGLPPGPINIPSISAIDAVLNYKKTNYLYFCASDKMDGTHNFASYYKAHLNNARRYSNKLNKMGIK